MTSILVCCPSPSCPGKSVQGQEVIRESWNATWHEPADNQFELGGEWASDITCPRCSEEGIDPESGQLDSAEEELGVRCKFCGVVSHGGVFTSAHADPSSDTWGNRVPRECPYCHEPEAFVGDLA